MSAVMNVTLIQVCQSHHHLDHKQNSDEPTAAMTPKNPKKTTRVSKLVAELTGKEIRYQKGKKNTIKQTY
jgi:hypothetical protein